MHTLPRVVRNPTLEPDQHILHELSEDWVEGKEQQVLKFHPLPLNHSTNGGYQGQLLLAFDSRICAMVQVAGVKIPFHVLRTAACGTWRPGTYISSWKHLWTDIYVFDPELTGTWELQLRKTRFSLINDERLRLRGWSFAKSPITDKYGPQRTRFTAQKLSVLFRGHSKNALFLPTHLAGSVEVSSAELSP